MRRGILPFLLIAAALPLAGCEVEPSDVGSTPNNGDDDDDDSGDDDDDDVGTIDEVIDDMEDGDGSITEAGGRAGAWYTYNDETAGAEQTPAMGADFEMTELDEANDGGTFAAHTFGQGFTEWGAGFGFDLNFPDGGTKGTYDASAYSGVTFWARRGADGPSTVLVTLNDDQTSPEGGQCDEAADECHDHFGGSIRLSEEWELHTIRFDDAVQEGWGKAFDSLHANALYSIQFQIAAGETFDIWIDTIGFSN